MKYIKSPLNYTGGKHKLLPQIIPNLPQNIDTFVDLFCGGCNVAVNIPAKKTVCNDREQKLIEIYKYFQTTPIETLLYYIYERINVFGLTKTDKTAYEKYRNFYNSNQHPLDLFVLICFSFSHYYRFNSKGEYNNPSGAGRSAYNPTLEKNLIRFVKAIQDKQIDFYAYDFLDIRKDSLTPDYFVFCDPPYNITYANYGLTWDMRYEFSLYAFLDNLNKKGVKFALTNVASHKGSVNNVLLQFAENYRIIELTSSYANSSYHTRREPSREIMVVNYP